jgi:Fe-S-cluster containining protein
MHPAKEKTTAIRSIFSAYGDLLHEIDSWFTSATNSHPDQIRCTSGCSECCRSLFDITMLDAACLREGFELLPEEVRTAVTTKAVRRLLDLRAKWPDLEAPYVINYRPEKEWQELMPADDETPCVLLDDNGRCLVYEHRPMTCRLHGLPLIDSSGEIMHDEWCTENFIGSNPLLLPELSAPFDTFFRREVTLDRDFTAELLGEVVYELDTFIPLALLIDFRAFDWLTWWQENRSKVLANSGLEQE